MPYLTICAFIAMSPSAFAQTTDGTAVADSPAPIHERPVHDDLDDLDLLDLEIPTVVTATRRERKLSTVPYAMSIITAEDIRRAGARSIPDALRLVPGMDVAELSYGNDAVSPRASAGFLSNQTLVLVDGRQIYDSLFGGTVWGSWPFQIEDIDRIEVIRGPGGVSWGANAVNGVINIITKDPKDQQGWTLSMSGGSHGTFKQHVGYGSTDGKLRFRLSGEYEASDGFPRGGSWLRPLDDEYKAGRLSLYGVFENGPDDTVRFSAGSAVVDGSFPPTPLAGFGARRNSGSQASFITGTWSHRIGRGNEVNWTVYVNDFYVSPGLPSIDYRYQQIALQFAHTFTHREVHRLSWGVDSRADLLDASNADPYMLSKSFIGSAVIGVYLQDEWRLAPRWTLDWGARVDYDSYGGFQPSARAALAYELTDDSVVYGAISRAFQMPTAAQRFLDIPMVNDLVRMKGHRGLDASPLVAFELGYRGAPVRRLETGLNLFWHELDDLPTLGARLGPPGLICVDFDNRAGASFYGLEADAKYAATDKLTLLANYTFERMDWHASVPFRDTDAMTPPEHKFMLGARYSPTENLHLSSHLYYVDHVEGPNPADFFAPRDVDAYFRLDLNAEYEFHDDMASITVGVRNLLDRNHYEGGTTFLNDTEVPRMIYAGFHLRIK